MSVPALHAAKQRLKQYDQAVADCHRACHPDEPCPACPPAWETGGGRAPITVEPGGPPMTPVERAAAYITEAEGKTGQPDYPGLWLDDARFALEAALDRDELASVVKRHVVKAFRGEEAVCTGCPRVEHPGFDRPQWPVVADRAEHIADAVIAHLLAEHPADHDDGYDREPQDGSDTW